ncbi:metallophosphoesterase [Thalassobius sp. I31.1]|uniref:metallophosphoesterase n=1 Tax=Thalassobius sp. I31.1 TaxID=2109912 RepID=UPI000D1A93CC|nr:metallophosphoesterase [Thalassobius sp. I31.1]
MTNISGKDDYWGIIPDIHADMSLLEAALDNLNHAQVERFAFLGDFIDAGNSVSHPNDQGVLVRVRQLIDQGTACAVMGNHELNAILFHSTGDDGLPLREHSKKNCAQHQSFIDQFDTNPTEKNDWIDWFLGLPLWLENQEFRLVHAYWGQSEINMIAARRPDGRLQREDLPEVASQNTDFGKAVQTLVCGPEIALPDGLWFEDFRGNKRHDVRVAWWRSGAKSWRDIGLSVPSPEALPDGLFSGELDDIWYPSGERPVFCGHYKMRGTPRLETTNVLCLDHPQDPHCFKFTGQDLHNLNLIKIL